MVENQYFYLHDNFITINPWCYVVINIEIDFLRKQSITDRIIHIFLSFCPCTKLETLNRVTDQHAHT